MAKRAPSFNFGFNKRPRKKKPKKTTTGKKRGSGGNAWRAYTVSNRPIPD